MKRDAKRRGWRGFKSCGIDGPEGPKHIDKKVD